MNSRVFLAIFLTVPVIDRIYPGLSMFEVCARLGVLLGIAWVVWMQNRWVSAAALTVGIAWVFLARFPWCPCHLTIWAFLATGVAILLVADRDPRILVRATLPAIYLLAAFHKMNSGFFDPEMSCTVDLPRKFWGEIFPSFQSFFAAGWMGSIFPFLTVILEGTLGVLLWIRKPRTVLMGLMLGFGFHFFLGVSSYYDFSSLMFALWFSYLSLEDDLIPLDLVWVGVVAFFLVAAQILGGIPDGIAARYLIYGLLIMFLCAGFVLAVFFRGRPILEIDPASHRMRAALGLWLLFFLSWNLQPYFGLRTTSVLSMFSNLRTEGEQGNHWLVPKSWSSVFSFQDRYFLLRASPLQGALSRFGGRNWEGERLNDWELRRLNGYLRKDGHTTYLVTLDGIETDLLADIRFSKPLGSWEAMLLHFRPLTAGSVQRCVW